MDMVTGPGIVRASVLRFRGILPSQCFAGPVVWQARAAPVPIFRSPKGMERREAPGRICEILPVRAHNAGPPSATARPCYQSPPLSGALAQ